MDLKKGAIYHVRWIGPNPYLPWQEFGICVRLHEIARNNDPNWPDMPFLARRFRPVVERKTSIRIFETILRNVRGPALTSAERTIP